VRVYAQASGASVSHLRTHRGEREVDLILEGPDGAVLACDVKLAEAIGNDDVRHLHWLQGVLGDDLVDAIIITTGKHAYRRPDGIAVIPLALLGP
jgi:predicted AAA+ superfamily ATPase